VDGSKFSLAQWKGKVVLIDFWATWCGPCMRELPNVKATYQAHHKDGFEIIGVSLDQDKAKLQQVIAAQGISWPQLFDGNGWDNVIAQQCAVRSIPATFLVGKDGVLIAAGLRGAQLDAAIAKALGQR
jgi:thiol-disulfide isomerase/thioredoxin